MAHTLSYQVQAPPAEVLKRIAEHTAPERLFLPVATSLTGRVGAKSFHIRHTISYHNSFARWAQGQVEPHEEGSRIHVTFGFSPFVKAFATIWFSLTSLVGLLGLISLPFGGDPQMAWGPFLMALLGGAVFGVSAAIGLRGDRALLRLMEDWWGPPLEP